jgi:hypothetical protein
MLKMPFFWCSCSSPNFFCAADYYISVLLHVTFPLYKQSVYPSFHVILYKLLHFPYSFLFFPLLHVGFHNGRR